jgi:hypothetical protein
MKRLAIVITLLCSASLFGQHIAEHDDNMADMEDDIRFKTVTFLNVEDNKVFYKREMKWRVDMGSFTFDNKTQWNRAKPTAGCYVALHCAAHAYLYSFYPCK